MVLLSILTVPIELAIAPPPPAVEAALLPLNVVLIILRVPSLRIPPPLPPLPLLKLAWLSLKVLFTINVNPVVEL